MANPIAVEDNPRRTYKYYDLIMAGFVTVLLCANVIGVSKRSTIMGYPFGTGILFFPLSYLFGDILTEVYGYARSRRVIWAGFAAEVFAAFMSFVIVAMPPAPGWDGQPMYERVFGSTPRIVLGRARYGTNTAAGRSGPPGGSFFDRPISGCPAALSAAFTFGRSAAIMRSRRASCAPSFGDSTAKTSYACFGGRRSPLAIKLINPPI